MDENCARRHAGFIGGRPLFAAFLDESFTTFAVDISDANKCTAMAAELRETGSGSVGAAWEVRIGELLRR